jgi:hypothetical protein
MMRRCFSLTPSLPLLFLFLVGSVQAQEADTSAAVPDPTTADTAMADEPLPADTAQTATRADTLATDSLAMTDTAAVADTAAMASLSAAEQRTRAKEQARTAATSWLALTDAGEFGKSWDAAAPSLQNSISREAWVRRGTQVRSTLDSLRSRTLTRTLYRDSTRQIPDTTAVVALQYTTEFAGRSVLEAVITTRADTTWKVAGYRVVPASRALSDSARTTADSVMQASPTDTTRTDTTQPPPEADTTQTP